MSKKIEKRIEKAKKQVEYFKNKVEDIIKKDPEAKNTPEYRLLKKRLRRAQRKLRKYTVLLNKTQPKKAEEEAES